MRTLITLFFLWLGILCFSQHSKPQTIIAEQGDGIYSLLRRAGIDPGPNVSAFKELNSDLLQGSDVLTVGVAYQIPPSDSIVQTNLKSKSNNTNTKAKAKEFDLTKVTASSTSLSNAKIYLLVGLNKNEKLLSTFPWFSQNIVENLSNHLMKEGAEVSLVGFLDNSQAEVFRAKDMADFRDERALSNRNQLGDFIETISSEYIKNKGKYQRLVILRFEEISSLSQSLGVQVYGYGGKKKSLGLAEYVVQSMAASTPQQSDPEIRTFENKMNVYLSRNIPVPTIMVDIFDGTQLMLGNRTLVAPSEKEIAHLVFQGLAKDYKEQMDLVSSTK